ncbi:MAG TPA: ABC transporter permease [Acidobacteriota bacterium]|nr:ABC transporter permease [Acidobacteriota bacterium]
MSGLLQGWVQDFRFSLRQFRRRRSFALLTVLTLALGIGGTTAVFSVFHGILLHPLPYPQSERLLWIYNEYEGNRTSNAVPDYLDRVEASRTLQSLAAMWTRDLNLTGQGDPVRVKAARVTASYFEVLGMSPLVGRTFQASHDVPGKDDVLVLSYGFWNRQFAGRRDAVGSSLQLDGRNYTILGVMPEGFDLPSSQVDLYCPAAFSDAQKQDSARGNEFMQVVGRMGEGVSLQQVEAEMDAIAANVIATVPSRADFLRRVDWGSAVVPFRERYVASLRAPLSVLLAAVACLLLIACVNVANLQLAQSALRSREVAVRTALGARPLRLLRQLLGESLLLSTLGGGAGLVLAAGLLRLLTAGAPDSFPLLANAGLNLPTLATALGLSLLTGLLTALAPAWKASGSDLSRTLYQSGRGGTGAGLALRRLLVVGEVALAVVLLTGAGLLLRSFVSLLRVDPGFSVTGRVSAEVSLPRAKYAEQAQRQAFFDQALEKLRARPGIDEAAAIDQLPLDPRPGTGTFYVQGQPPAPGRKQPGGEFKVVTPGLFKTLGISLLQGREFTARDDASSAPVVIVNQRLAETYWPDENPIGKRLGGSQQGPWREVVGVVASVHSKTLAGEIPNQVYLPYAQTGGPLSMVLVAEGGLPPGFMARDIRAVVSSLDAQQPIYNVRTLSRQVERTLDPNRYPMLLLGAFAGLGLVLAAVGIFGVISAFVSQRTREIGVRIALGGRPSHIRGLILRQGLTLAALGLLLGLAASLALSRLLSSLLFGVSPNDPLTLAAVASMVLLLTLLPCYTPARRATRIDPAQALSAD